MASLKTVGMRSSTRAKMAGGLLILAFGFAIGCNKSGPPAAIQQQASHGDSQSAPNPVSASEPASDSDAIRAAISEHLRSAGGINMAAMDMSVDSIAINGDQAQADATFRVKQGGATMKMTYFLNRHANGWLVIKNQPADGQFVHPPLDMTHSGSAPSPADPSFPNFREYLKQHPPSK